MPLRRAVFAILFASLGSPLVAAETPLRLERLERCGDLLASERQEWCLRVRGLGSGLPRLLLDGRELPTTAPGARATACSSAWTAVATPAVRFGWSRAGAAAIRYG